MNRRKINPLFSLDEPVTVLDWALFAAAMLVIAWGLS